MTPDHAKAVELIRKLKRVNPTGKLVLALADELGRREQETCAWVEDDEGMCDAAVVVTAVVSVDYTVELEEPPHE